MNFWRNLFALWLQHLSCPTLLLLATPSKVNFIFWPVPVNKNLGSEDMASDPRSAKLSFKALPLKKQGTFCWDKEWHWLTLYWNYFLVLFCRLRNKVLKMGCNLARSNHTEEARGNEHLEEPGLASGSAYTATFPWHKPLKCLFPSSTTPCVQK